MIATQIIVTGLLAVIFVLVCWLAVEIARRMDAEAVLSAAHQRLDHELDLHDREMARRAFLAGVRDQFDRESA
jgi:C4-dicarboxylate-specific signal transduction histidine kinase